MTDKPKMRIQSITMDGSRVTDIEVVPVDAITGTQRCEPPNLVVEGCTVHNTVTLDLALVRALVEALEAAEILAHSSGVIRGRTPEDDDIYTVEIDHLRDLDAAIDAARAAIAKATGA